MYRRAVAAAPHDPKPSIEFLHSRMLRETTVRGAIEDKRSVKNYEIVNGGKKIDVHNPDLNVQLAALLMQDGMDREAYDVLRQTLKANPDHVGALASEGNVLRLRAAEHFEGRPELALRILNKAERRLLRALELDPSHAPTLSFYAQLLHVEDRIPEAEKAWEQAMKASEGWDSRFVASTWCNYATFLWDRQGKVTEAQQLLESSLRLAPGYLPAKQSLASLQAMGGNVSQATAMFEKILALDPESGAPRSDLEYLRGLNKTQKS
mmetsp:Transcript_36363/g.56830  ORF Transcript_36363/g.56830 Transcript_36363/m.56830 type:complete len:265 (-) Transcript_36363:64-858(-)